MPHLVSATTTLTPIMDYLRDLEQAHDALVGAYLTVPPIMPVTRTWGVDMKRLRVRIPTIGLLPGGVDRHGEIVNQVATIERLLFALQWCLRNFSAKLTDGYATANPTTSSNGHDLVIWNSAKKAVFAVEACDVVQGTSNNKMPGDLRTLLQCSRTPCVCHNTTKLMATSHASGRWLASQNGQVVSGIGPLVTSVLFPPAPLPAPEAQLTSDTWIVKVA